MHKRIIFIVLLILPTFTSLIRSGYFPMYDDMQVLRLHQMDKCINDFHTSCRWVPDLGFGYGYPLYMFYAPLPYFVMDLFHKIGFSFIGSIKLGFVTALGVSAVLFYLLAKRFLSSTAAIFATILFAYSPFKATDLYVRGAMGEVWGMALLPLPFLTFEIFINSPDLVRMVLFATGLAVLLITHNLTVLMTTPFLLAWICVRLWQRKFENLFLTLCGLVLGLGLAGFFILPLIAERNLVQLETLTQGYFNFLAHFVSLKQLLLSFHAGFGPSIFGPNDDVSLGVGPFQILFGFLGLIGSLAFSTRSKFRPILILLGLVTFASLFLTHEKSTFLWNSIPYLNIFQFPWRFVLIATFSLSLAGGLLLEIFPKNLKLIGLAILGGIVIFANVKFFKPKEWLNIDDEYKLSGRQWQLGVTASINDFLPISVKESPKAGAPDNPFISQGDVTVSYLDRGTDWYTYQVEVNSPSASVSIPAYNFPNWDILVDNKSQAYRPTGSLGLPTLNLLQGEHVIFAKLNKTWPRIMGDYITLISLLVSLYLIGIRTRQNIHE